MLYNLNKYVLYIIVLFTLMSCEESINMDFDEEQTVDLVVESWLSDNLEPFKVSLHKPILNPGDESEPVVGANVTISFNNTNIELVESENKQGVYVSENARRAVVNTNYVLNINYAGKTYSATTNMIGITPFTQLRYKNAGVSSLYYLEPTLDSEENAMWKIEYDWSRGETCDTCYATTYLYTLHSLNTSQIFDASNQKILVPDKTKVTQTKYSLTQSQADFYRDMLMETRWSGSVLGEASGQVEGNISNGAVGYFGASAILTSSFIIGKQ